MIKTGRRSLAVGIVMSSATFVAMFTVFGARPLAQSDVFYACIAHEDSEKGRDNPRTGGASFSPHGFTSETMPSSFATACSCFASSS